MFNFVNIQLNTAINSLIKNSTIKSKFIDQYINFLMKKIKNSQQLSILQTSLVWQDLSASLKDKTIIQNSTGYCKPGEMLAIMGSSGAGKTTLLTLLSGKKANELKITGSVEANNTQFTAQQFYNFGVYIYQNDILHQSLTVRCTFIYDGNLETLQFIAKLKYKSQEEIVQRVNELIKIFQLQKCQNTYVGGRTTKGISGGQKKRVSIAMQMVAKPSVIILDQPTTGLDSNKANKIVKILKKIATEENRTIIFTLSQPSSATYKQLDRLILLDKGKTLYQGKSEAIYQYMTSLNIKVPQNSSLSDFFIMEISQFKALKDEKITQMSNQAYSLKLQPDIIQKIKKTKNDIECEGYTKLKPVRSFLFSFKLLLWREFTIFVRNPSKGIRILFNAIFMLVVHGLMFLHAISDNRPIPISQNDTITYPIAELIFYFITAQGIIYVSIFTNIMTAISNVTLSFPTDRQIFYKETISKKYVPFSYLLAKIIMETASIFFGVFLYGICVYFMIGYTQNLVQFCLALMCTTMVGNSLGIMSGSFYKDAKKSSALSLQLVPPMILLGGLYNKIKSIPEYIRWLTFLSPFRQGIHSLLILEYQDTTYRSQQGRIYDFQQDLSVQLSYWGNIGVLFGIAGVYYLVAFFFMIKKSSS